MAKTDPKAKASVFTCVIAFMSSILVSGEKTTLKFNIALKRYTSEERITAGTDAQDYEMRSPYVERKKPMFIFHYLQARFS